MKKPEVRIQAMITSEQNECLQRLANDYDKTTGAIVREALAEYIAVCDRMADAPTRQVPSGNTQPAPTLEKYKPTVGSAVMASSDWNELAINLARHDLELAPKGGGLVVCRKSEQKVLCKASELGFPYSKLIKRYQCGYPGHSHTWLVDRVLNNENQEVFE